MTTKKKIFLASSSELKADREQFENFINRKNKAWIDNGIFLELVIWEDFLDAMSQTRSQDEYNQAIQDCDLFVLLFFTKVGKYTEEEFDKAYQQFKATHKPLIFTYFKDNPISTQTVDRGDLQSLWAFQDKLKALEHFYRIYKNTEDLLHQFGEQLDKLGANGFFSSLSIPYGEQKIPKHLTRPPFIPEIFEGRDDDLTVIHDKLLVGGKLLLLVNGEGGIGKTSLAAKYWQRYENEYNHTAWLFAQTNLQEALLALARPLGLLFDEKQNGDERLELLLQAMSNLTNPCLLVLDNVNELAELNQHYPSLRSCPNFHILLTTRITQYEQAESYAIQPLSEDDALAVFKTHYPKHRAEEDATFKAIRTAVGGNTLVLELLAKNLAVINTDEVFYPLAQLLTDLQEKGLLQLSQTEPVSIQGKGQQAILNKALPTDIIRALYDEMEMVTPLTVIEQQLLSNLAVMPSENLSYDFLKTLLTPEDVKSFSKTLSGLAQRGWLEKSVQGDHSVYKISPVVQEITRDKNRDSLLGDCAALIGNLLTQLTKDDTTGHLRPEATNFSRYAEAVVNSMTTNSTFDLFMLGGAIGNYHTTTGNIDLALTYYSKACDMVKALSAANPENEDFKNNLAVSYSKLGQTHTALGDLAQALVYYQDYNRLKQELHAAYPSNVSFKGGLAISYQYLGNTQTALGDLAQALVYYQDHNRLEQELHAAYPSNVEFKNGLAISYQDLGDTQATLGNLEQALVYYQDHNRLEQELHAAYPSNVKFKNGLAISYSKLGETLEALGNLEQALVYYQDFNRIERELYEVYPSNVWFKNGLAISYSKLGDTHTALGNLAQALGYFEERSRLGKELYEAYPNNVVFKNGLAISYIKLGWLYETKLAYPQKALDYYLQSKLLLAQLVSQFPSYIEFKKNLAWVENRINTLS